MEAALTRRQRHGGPVECRPKPYAEPPVDVESEQPLALVALESAGMVGERHHELGRQMHAPGIAVLGLGQVNALAVQVDIGELDRHGLAQAHAGVEQKAQEQPELGIVLVGGGEYGKRLMRFEPRHRLGRLPADRALEVRLDAGAAQHGDDRGVDLPVAGSGGGDRVNLGRGLVDRHLADLVERHAAEVQNQRAQKPIVAAGRHVCVGRSRKAGLLLGRNDTTFDVPFEPLEDFLGE